MGQYYRPVLLDAEGRVKGSFESHEYGNGFKLMEHSWMGYDFVHAVEIVLALDGAQRLVGAGDYADPEPDTDSVLFALADDAPTLRPATTGLNSAEYMTAVEATFTPPFEIDDRVHRYLVNHDRGEYVDKLAVPSAHGWTIHPLPLLTCEGNGRGGGDFRDEDPRGLVGRWARHRISVSEHKPEDLTELAFDLVEK